MSRKWIQNTVIILVLLVSLAAVIFLGIDQGKKNCSLQETGIPLSEKISWEEAVASLQKPETDPTVYVTNRGTKYHLSPDCSGLRNAKEIIGTRLSSALADGKDLCSLCGEE